MAKNTRSQGGDEFHTFWRDLEKMIMGLSKDLQMVTKKMGVVDQLTVQVENLETTVVKIHLCLRIMPARALSITKVLVLKSIPEPQLPLLDPNHEFTLEPTKILATRSTPKGKYHITEVLTRWSGQSAFQATWERLYIIRKDFPHLVGTVLQGGGSCNSAIVDQHQKEDLAENLHIKTGDLTNNMGEDQQSLSSYEEDKGRNTEMLQSEIYNVIQQLGLQYGQSVEA